MIIEIPEKMLLKKNAEPELRLAVAVALFRNGWLDRESAVRLSGASKAKFDKALSDKDPVVPKGSGTGQQTDRNDSIISALAGPTKTGFDFEQILEEQGYPGPDKSRMESMVKALDIREPLNELLAALSA